MTAAGSQREQRRNGCRAAVVAVALLSAVPAMAQTPPAFKSIRFEEDYRYLRDPAARTDFWDPIKYVPLGTDAYLSLGGEVRERAETVSAPLFGLRGGGGDTYLLHRLLLHGDLHVTQDFRAFVQLGNHVQAGKDAPLAQSDVDRFDLQQAFVDVALPLDEADPTLRLGRQELSFGGQRLVSLRESPNLRRAFDGVRISDTIGGVKLDGFVTRPVQPKQGSFDDQPNRAQAFWGVYGTLPLAASGQGIDVYYLGLDNETARFATIGGGEHRHTIGTRLFGSGGGWDWDWEAAGQFGSIAGQDIRAWTVGTITGFTLADLPWKPRLGLKANAASGDRNARDRSLGTFNPLFPRLAYFNEASLIAPGNFFDAYPMVTVRPLAAVTVSAGWDFLWRQTTADAVYTNPFTPVAGTAGRGGRRIGDQIVLDLAWQADRHLTVAASYVHFNAGAALTAVGGSDVDFGMLSMAYRF